MINKVDYIQWLERERERLTFRNKKIKAERDTLIDDLSWYKAKVSRLEQEKEGLRLDIDSLDALSFEQSLDASRYWALTSHIRMKAENNPGVSRYIDLVNYIDRLERGDGEKI